MAELKTKVNDARVEDFLNKIEDLQKREFAFTICELMKSITKSEPKMGRQHCRIWNLPL